MIWLSPYVQRIRQLLSEDSETHLTYAALECRLAIEHVCYERLRQAHDYISHDDLRKWQPREVVNTLLQEVDCNVAKELTLSIGRTPVPEGKEMTREDFEAVEYIKVGTQIGFDPERLGKLWNAISSFLHLRVPKDVNDHITTYADKDKLRRKVEEALAEIDRLSKGTLTMGGVGETVSFVCNCDTLNKRRAALLKHGQVVNCINPRCTESWTVEVEGDDIGFQRRSLSVTCRNCGKPTSFPEKVMLSLARNQVAHFECGCGEKNYVTWKLMQAAPKTEQTS